MIFLSCVSLLQAQSKLNIREIYDFNIGDEFHYVYSFSNNGFRYRIINKQMSKAGDSILYMTKIDYYKFNYVVPKIIYEFGTDTQNFAYTHLDSSIGILYLNHYGKDSCNIFKDSFSFSNKHKVESYGYRHNNICLFEGEINSEEFGKGLGCTYKYYGDPKNSPAYSFSLVYYKKGLIEVGRPDTAYKAGITWKQEVFLVYPNPVHSELYFSEELFLNSKVTIVNYLGVCYYKNSVSNNKINVENFPPGLYYMRLENDNKIYTSRFMKN